MAEKKKIKGIKDNTGNGGGITITVGDAYPKAGVAPGADLEFNQPHAVALCFNVGDVLNTETITPAGTTTPVVVFARRIQGGTVTATANDNSGTIEENRTKKVINFYQTNLRDLGIAAGVDVKYDLVQDLIRGGEIAVNVHIDPNI